MNELVQSGIQLIKLMQSMNKDSEIIINLPVTSEGLVERTQKFTLSQMFVIENIPSHLHYKYVSLINVRYNKMEVTLK